MLFHTVIFCVLFLSSSVDELSQEVCVPSGGFCTTECAITQMPYIKVFIKDYGILCFGAACSFMEIEKH
jgi:hypothetical protein